MKYLKNMTLSMKMKSFLIYGLFLVASSTMAQSNNDTNSTVNYWKNWDLVIVTLDKNEKPSNKATLPLMKPVAIKKDKGPEIIVQDIELENGIGRLLRIQCGDSLITQKFENPNQLKGWAVQLSCFKQSYYFIINPSLLNIPVAVPQTDNSGTN